MNLQSVYVAVTRQQIEAGQKRHGSGEYSQSQLACVG